MENNDLYKTCPFQSWEQNIGGKSISFLWLLTLHSTVTVSFLRKQIDFSSNHFTSIKPAEKGIFKFLNSIFKKFVVVEIVLKAEKLGSGNQEAGV